MMMPNLRLDKLLGIAHGSVVATVALTHPRQGYSQRFNHST